MFANAIKQSLKSSVIASRSLNLAMAKTTSTRFFSEYKSVRAAIDGNEAAADSAYNVSDAAILYPISPSSAMGEHADAWAVKGRKNIFGNTLRVTEMQSEGGAAGALHGALVGGLLGTTFTASQGMMLMIPNMYRIAGGLLPAVIHVASRVVSKQALSLLCEHSDVMATRQTGFAILSSHCVQEAHDLALVAHLSAITSSVPFLHFFDGWRVSHEVNSISKIPCEEVAKIYPYEAANDFRKRALNPNHPYQRGIAQSQDIYMQNCVVAQPYYDACPEKVQAAMDKVASITGRQYHLFDYVGAPDADRVIVVMGAGTTVEETVNYLNKHGEKVGVVKVHLFRPFSRKHLDAAIPKSVKKICVLDRCREDGAPGEPLYLDVVATMDQLKRKATIVGGQIGLGGKDFTPAMVKGCFDNLNLAEPKNRFVVGVNDDLCHTSIPYGETLHTLPADVKQCIFWGYGSDGTVGASHDAVKMIVGNTDFNAQAYSVYDAHKSGGLTVSHVRVGKDPIQSEYLVQEADYVACHNSTYVRKFHMVKQLKEGGIFVLNSPWNTVEELEKNLPNHLKRDLALKKAQFYNIDATAVAQSVGLKQRINMIMQSVFFNLCPILPEGRAPKLLETDIVKKFSSKGKELVDMNLNAVKQSLSNLHKIEVPASWATLGEDAPRVWPAGTPEFLKTLYPALYSEGDTLPVSKFVVGGVQPAGTSKYEKRGIATIVPIWDAEKCTQCNLCATLCTHVCIRPFLLDAEEQKRAPASFKTIPAAGDELKGLNFRIQVSPMDCSSCEVCSVNCPTHALTMKNFREVSEVESKNWDFAMTLKNKGNLLDKNTVKGCAFQEPLLEFPGACAGCGETQSVRILTQLFGKRLMVANAMGCSRVWGGTFASNPYTVNARGQGPAWGSSLFEDNAEFGFGMMTSTLIKRRNLATRVQRILKDDSIPKSKELCATLQTWLENPHDADKCEACYDNAIRLLATEKKNHKELELLEEVVDVMPKLTQWVVGGDGWAYDIGYGGVDHVLAQGEDINVLVLDTEMYANTGGQQSKATQMSAVAKFAAGGKPLMKKDLGRMAMQYKNVYVASIAVAADPRQAIKAISEAESYDGPSLVINYSPCQQHGMPSTKGMSCMAQEAEHAVSSGYWPLYRYDPRRAAKGENPFQLDYKKLKTDVADFLKGESRFTTLDKTLPDVASNLHQELKKQIIERHEDRVRMAMSDKQLYKYLQKKFEKK